jgi:hypothetical protein
LRHHLGVSRLAVVPVLLVLALAGCGEDEPDRATVAAAKCGLPVEQELGPTGEEYVDQEVKEVTDLGEGRYRVTGTAAHLGLPDHDSARYEYVCEVSPDASDRLRGFRVDRLEVTPY